MAKPIPTHAIPTPASEGRLEAIRCLSEAVTRLANANGSAASMRLTCDAIAGAILELGPEAAKRVRVTVDAELAMQRSEQRRAGKGGA